MKYSLFRGSLRWALAVVAALAACGLSARSASAQAFNAFNPVTLDSGATWTVNGTAVTSSNIFSVLGAGTDNVDFGFSTAGSAIDLTLSNNTVVQLTGIESIVLVSGAGDGSVTATTPGKKSTANIFDYTGAA